MRTIGIKLIPIVLVFWLWLFGAVYGSDLGSDSSSGFDLDLRQKLLRMKVDMEHEYAIRCINPSCNLDYDMTSYHLGSVNSVRVENCNYTNLTCHDNGDRMIHPVNTGYWSTRPLRLPKRRCVSLRRSRAGWSSCIQSLILRLSPSTTGTTDSTRPSI